MKKEMLSVVIPAYNLENYIEECVNSIRNQSYHNLEIIIVDDGSTDKTNEICQRVAMEDSRITLLNQKNSGVTTARLRGIQAAHGKYITFVDGDDYLDSVMYEKMLPYMEHFDMVNCGISQENGYGYKNTVLGDFEGAYDTYTKMEELWKKMLYDFEKPKLHPLSPSIVNKIFVREILLPIMSNINSSINYGEDAAVVLLYALQCKSIMFLKEVYYYYRFRESSATHSINRNMLESSYCIYKLLKNEFDKHYMSISLNMQLEKWMIYLLIYSVNKYMGFSEENRIPQFWIGLDEFVGKRIVVYGAGQMGQDVVWAYKQMGQEVYAWIDKEYEKYQEKGMNVQSIDVLKDEQIEKKVQTILIAVSNPNLANTIKENLKRLGISDDLIVWKKPIKVI